MKRLIKETMMFLKNMGASFDFGEVLNQKIKTLYKTYFGVKRWNIGGYGFGTLDPSYDTFRKDLTDLCGWAMKEDRDLNAPSVKIIKEIALDVKEGKKLPEFAIDEILSLFGYIAMSDVNGEYKLISVRRYTTVEGYMQFKDKFEEESLKRIEYINNSKELPQILLEEGKNKKENE